MKQWQVCAVLAALCNASIGSISKVLFHTGLTPAQVAFYKCLLAFLLVSMINIHKLHHFIQRRKREWWKIAVCAFFGIFTLYFFETKGYAYTSIATVVFVLLGSSTITTFLMGRLILKESIGPYQYAAVLFALIGLGVMIKPAPGAHWSMGGILAAIAGVGYGLFFISSKKFKLKTTGLDFMWWFIGFGCLFLLFPFLSSHPSLPAADSFIGLLLLAIIPTLGGYYFTTRALSQGLASGVQIFELSEPIFATIFGFFLLKEGVNMHEIVGGALILLAIYFFNKKLL